MMLTMTNLSVNKDQQVEERRFTSCRKERHGVQGKVNPEFSEQYSALLSHQLLSVSSDSDSLSLPFIFVMFVVIITNLQQLLLYILFIILNTAHISTNLNQI